MRRRRSDRLFVLVGFLGLLQTVASCAPSKGSAHAVTDHPLLGASAPPLEVPTPDGQSKVALANHAGSVVIVDFWATWCEPCRESFPAYQRLVDEFGGRLVVLAISVDESPSGILAFATATGAKFPMGWDEGQHAAESYAPPKMPTSFIVDKSGIVRFVHAGFTAGDEVEIGRHVRSLL